LFLFNQKSRIYIILEILGTVWDIDRQLLRLNWRRLLLNRWYRYWGQVMPPNQTSIFRHLLFLSKSFSSSVNKMTYSKNGVSIYHAWACVSHRTTNLFSHFGSVAMHGAISAGGLPFAERAFCQALSSILREFRTVRT
jgi:hypothetical protein